MGEAINDFLFTSNEILLFLGLYVVLLIFYLAGYYFGSFNKTELALGQIRMKIAMQGGLMSLLSLILAFTFSSSSARFEKRKEVVLSEANAISTAYIHSIVLPDSLRLKYRKLLNEYIDIRIEYVIAARKHVKMDSLDTVTLNKQLEIATLLRNYVWDDPTKYSDFIQSSSVMLEESLKGSMVSQNHVPFLVLLLLVVISCFTMAGFGYGSAIVRNLNALYAIFLKILVCSIFITIIDLDRLDAGIIRKSEDSLIELKKIITRFQQ